MDPSAHAGPCARPLDPCAALTLGGGALAARRHDGVLDPTDGGGCNLHMEILRRALYSKDVALQANPGSWQQQQLLQSQGPGPE